jgi:hypothetical protein
MKMTLLGLVQAVLSAIDSDEVNSISDSTEALQVADIVRDTYYELHGRRNWPNLNKLIQFENISDTTKPTYLAISDEVKELQWVNYDVAKEDDTRKLFRPVYYQHPDDFIYRLNDRNSDNENIEISTDFSGVELLIRNDTRPQYWTSFDDKHLVFDAYDSAVDSTIHAAKAQAQAFVTPEWEMKDDFVPFMKAEAFPLLLAESKSMAFINIKQMVNEKEEARARKHDRWNSRKAYALHGGVRYPNYGRSNSESRYRKQPLEKNNVTPESSSSSSS